MGQDLEVGADLGDQITDHQAVQDPERMIRDHHDRPLGRDRLKARRIVVDLEPEMAHRRFPEAFARARPAPILDVDPLQARLPGQALDGPDGDPTERRIVR